jgi:hypothetical protein
MAISLRGELHRLATADEALAERLDYRLRSLEESAARAEAEARFLASRFDNHQTGCTSRTQVVADEVRPEPTP